MEAPGHRAGEKRREEMGKRGKREEGRERGRLFLLNSSTSTEEKKNISPLSKKQAAIDAVAGPALSGDIQCFVGPSGTVVGLKYGSAQVKRVVVGWKEREKVFFLREFFFLFRKTTTTTSSSSSTPLPPAQVCETSPNVVDIKIGTGFVSNVKVILATPNATIGGLEFVVTTGKKSQSTFCGRALGLSAWIGKPGQAVGAIGGTCNAPVVAAARRRRRGRSLLEEEGGGEKLKEAAEGTPEQEQPETAAAADAPSSKPEGGSGPPPPLLPPPPQQQQQEQQQQPPPRPPPRRQRDHPHHHDEDDEEQAAASPAFAPAPAPADVVALSPAASAPPSLSRRSLLQAPTNGTKGGLSAGTLQVVLVPAPQGENDSGAYGNGTIFGG